MKTLIAFIGLGSLTLNSKQCFFLLDKQSDEIGRLGIARVRYMGPVGRQQLRYTGLPISSILPFYYYCITFTVIQ